MRPHAGPRLGAIFLAALLASVAAFLQTAPVFLLELSRYLGFRPEPAPDGGADAWFDLQEGTYVAERPGHPYHVPPGEHALLHRASSMRLERLEPLSANPAERLALLDTLLDYFRLHVDGFGQLRSPGVLREVLAR